MAELKITKNELRNQQSKLNQLRKYLPTLQLKKALLQAEVSEARLEIYGLEEERDGEKRAVDDYASLFTQQIPCDVHHFTAIQHIYKRYENIAGAEVPFFEGADFAPITYDLFETPVWLEAGLAGIKAVSKLNAHIGVTREKLSILEHELREVTIRVNLFEKILIPRCEKNIKKIKVFLGDQQLAAVSQAKVAKAKILQREEGELHAY
ncbi:MAG: V-type ATP synthase subunit D [Verrucomicrobia bacterium]|nr:V-type ATP synthase subunit D [Verrucomicrobiota bacterium]